jgi:transcriptional regulator with XRE-family HTH domain
MKATFGEYIKKLRTDNKLTLTQLAYKLDLDAANLSKIENGKRDFDKKRLTKLAETFKLDLKELNNEFVSDLIAKQIYETNCSSELLLVAEQKAEYRRKINQNKTEKAI